MWRSFFQMREVLMRGLPQVNVSSSEALQQTVDSLILVMVFRAGVLYKHMHL